MNETFIIANDYGNYIGYEFDTREEAEAYLADWLATHPEDTNYEVI